jgi:hypothetical protein
LLRLKEGIVDPLGELKLAVARLKERLDELSPEPPPSREKLDLMSDIKSFARSQGRVAAWRIFGDKIGRELTQAEFDACVQE